MKSAKIKPKDDKIIISSEYFQNERPSYLCSFSNMTLSRLSDAGGNNSTYWCRHCSVEFNPAEENLRRESKLEVPDRNTEQAITSIDVKHDGSIHKEPQFKGTFKRLLEKGMRITNYKEDIPKQ